MRAELPSLQAKVNQFKTAVVKATVAHATLYTAHENGIIQTQPLSGQATPKLFKGHKAPLSTFERSPDNCLICSSSLDGSIKLWNITSGQTPRVQQIKKLSEPVRAVRFSPNSSLLVVGCDDKIARLLSVESWRQLATFGAHTNWVTAVDVSEKNLLTGGADKRILLWDLPTETPIWSSKDHAATVRSVRFVDPNSFISAAADGMIKIYDARSQQPICNMKAHEGAVSDLDVYDSVLLSCGSDSKIKLFDVRFSERRAVVDACGHAATFARFYNSGLNFVTAHDNFSVGLWDTGIGPATRKVLPPVSTTGQEAEMHQALDGVVQQLSAVTEAVKLMTARIQTNEAQIAQLMRLVKTDIERGSLP